MTSAIITIWGVVYSVSLAWAFYNLLDQWPRIIHFGSVLRDESKMNDTEPKFSSVNISCWLLLIFLVVISLSSFMYGAFEFGEAYTYKRDDLRNRILLLIIVSLSASIVFITPFFINRAVWGFAIFLFPGEFKKFIDDPQNIIYWERRLSIKTCELLYTHPKLGGGSIFIDSLIWVFLLSSSIFLPWVFFTPSLLFWIHFLPIVILFAVILHDPWPERV